MFSQSGDFFIGKNASYVHYGMLKAFNQTLYGRNRCITYIIDVVVGGLCVGG